jgi:hypothetical protein
MTTNVHFLSYPAQFLLEEKIFQRNIVEKIRTHILYQSLFCVKSCRLWDNVETYGGAGGQATDGKVAHARCMLGN